MVFLDGPFAIFDIFCRSSFRKGGISHGCESSEKKLMVLEKQGTTRRAMKLVMDKPFPGTLIDR